MNTDLNALISVFLQEFVAIEGKAKSTVRTWGPALHRFTRWIEEREGHPATVTDFNADILDAFHLHIAMHKTKKTGLPIRPRTLDTYVMALRALGRWLLHKRRLTENPAMSLKRPKRDAVERRPVTDAEFRALLEGCKRLYPPHRAALATAVISILGYAGLRRHELVALRLTDVTLETDDPGVGIIVVKKGKGGKRREVFIPEPCIEAICAYLKLRPKTQSDYLLMYDSARHFADRSMTALFAEVKTAAGLGNADHITCHPMRHGYATRLLKNGCDLLSISKSLGHSSLQITQIYLHNDRDQLKKTVKFAMLPQPEAQPTPVATQPQQDKHAEATATTSGRFQRVSLRRDPPPKPAPEPKGDPILARPRRRNTR
jgi:site-specific recombinase XerD